MTNARKPDIEWCATAVRGFAERVARERDLDAKVVLRGSGPEACAAQRELAYVASEVLQLKDGELAAALGWTPAEVGRALRRFEAELFAETDAGQVLRRRMAVVLAPAEAQAA
jgi:hypothetical protein